MCTPDGYIFSKEAILQNLLDQKKANKRKFSAWKAQQDEEERKVMLWHALASSWMVGSPRAPAHGSC